jgi:hypothetical protein
MAFLLIFRADQGVFAEPEAFNKLGSIGVRDLRRNSMPGSAIAGHFDFSNDTVLIELKSDLQAFAVSDFGPASLEFAIRLQAHFKEPLRIVDEAYSFDLGLKSMSTADQLQKAILQAPD